MSDAMRIWLYNRFLSDEATNLAQSVSKYTANVSDLAILVIRKQCAGECL